MSRLRYRAVDSRKEHSIMPKEKHTTERLDKWGMETSMPLEIVIPAVVAVTANA